MDRYSLAIVIPAYNESATIANIVRAALHYGIPIVVDDASTDQTAQIAKDVGAEVVSHHSNAGYDASLNSGFSYANEKGCDFVLTMDADGQHNPLLLPVFIDALEKGADMVVGVRHRKQRMAEHLFALVSWFLWGIRDPLCGLKAYRIELYRSLGHFDAYSSIGTELAIYAARQSKKIAQIPLTTIDRTDVPRFGQAYNANMQIMKALFNAF
ncbi:glycosyltransferase family 2 protein [Gammaproteobacteria bacterium]|nr:glycosyltransferase family 2 protein [Gammaproteobacteria bacterium]MDC1015486.1 glycosyltransferase family 2 protein [Gammaproteobacteria bacterium]